MAWSDKPAYLPSNWRSIRARVLAEQPDCDCGRPATDVDHLVPVHLGGTHEPQNLQALCRTCHNDKTQREARAARRTRKRPPETHPNARR